MKQTQMIKLIMLILAFLPGVVFAGVRSGDTAWMLTSTALVLFMTPGLAFFYAGMVRRKNVVATLFQNWLAIPVLGLLWAVVGYSLAFPGDLSHLMLKGVSTYPQAGQGIPHSLFMMFQMMFAIITPILMVGAFVERTCFKSWIVVMVLWSLCVYYPVCHWVWGDGGWLGKLGVADFAGGFVVHMTAGFSALIAAIIIGKRKDGSGAGNYDTGMVALGTAILWFGWFGFNAGSALGANKQAIIAFCNTFFSGAAGLLTWMLVDWLKDGKPTLTGACIGAVVGLVVITPGAGLVAMASSIVMGGLGGVISNFAARFVKKSLKIDDTLDVFACHGIGGLTGLILTGIFAERAIGGMRGLLEGSSKLLINQLIGIGAVALLSMIATAIILKVVGAVLPLRVTAARESAGLDSSCHGEKVSDDS